jgi:hypothetical protein
MHNPPHPYSEALVQEQEPVQLHGDKQQNPVEGERGKSPADHPPKLLYQMKSSQAGGHRLG